MSEERAEGEAAGMYGYQDPEFPDVHDGWHISSLAELDWSMGRLADLEREQEENRIIADTAMQRIRDRTRLLNERLAKHAEWFRGCIASYAENHKAELIPGKKKSRSLLHGVISWRKVGGGLQVLDKDALLNWARAQPVEREVLRIKDEPAMDAIKEHFKASGEVPPGCDVAPEKDELGIKPLWGDGGGNE